MNILIQHYLDGELSEEQAESFLAAVAQDPDLETELRIYENLLVALASPSPQQPVPDLCDRVMDRVTEVSARNVRPSGASSRQLRLTRLAWAAGLILVFGLGYLVAHVGSDPGAIPADGPDRSLATASGGGQSANLARTASAGGELRLVRLVYVPRNAEVEKVTVAGSFNAWNPGVTPMQKEGNVWVAQFILPPAAYEYMFVEDDVNWITDPLALQTRDDGFGKKNAVLDLTL